MKIFNVMKYYKANFIVSGAIILLGLIMLVVNGFNLGIDFSGGTMMQIDLGKTVSVKEVTELISEFDLEPEIVHSGAEQTEIIIKTNKSLDNETRANIFSKFQEKYSLDAAALKGAEQFGPNMGKEIRNKAIYAILIASAVMLVYIWIRFEAVFGVAAVMALLHDILILTSIYVIFRWPINSAYIAAILTITGYSINDTIVVFDRIRENIKREKNKDHFEIANNAVKQTITRTINTGMATLFVIACLYVMGSQSIKDLALPLFLGILIGTYSSIFIASPVWALTRNYIGSKGSYASK